MAVIHRVCIFRIELNRTVVDIDDRLRNQERGDGADRAVCLYDRLDEARRVGGRLKKQPASPGVGAEMKVKRPVLLEKNEDVFDVLLKQSLLLSVCENRLDLRIPSVTGDFGAGSRGDVDNFLLAGGMVCWIFRQRSH